MTGFGFGQKVGLQIVRNKLILEPTIFKGMFNLEHHRAGKLIKRLEVPNGVVNQGKSDILGVAFAAATQHTAWYLGLIAYPVSSGPAAGDTIASHAGWVEFTSYTDTNNGGNATTRPEWGPDAPAAGITNIKNSTPSEFLIATGGGSLQIYGIFCTNEQTKSGSGSGKFLWATAPFTSPIEVANADVLKLTYTVSVTGS